MDEHTAGGFEAKGDIPSMVRDFIDNPKLQLVSSDDFSFLSNANEMRSRFGKFSAFIERICNIYFYMRVNWLHVPHF